MMEGVTSPRRLIRFGAFELNVSSGELQKNGARLALSDQPLEILKALIERPSEVVSREELRQRVWAADTFVDFEHGLNAAIRRLRDALGDAADSPRYIETVPKRGYRFIAPVLDGVSPRAHRLSLGRTGWIVTVFIAAALILGIAMRSIIPRAGELMNISGGAEADNLALSPVRFTLNVDGTDGPGPDAGLDGLLALCCVDGLLALCPDGSCMVYLGAGHSMRQLYYRSFDQLTSSELPGTERGYSPFFSQDGRSLAFFADGQLMKMSLGTLAVETVTRAPDARGGTWSADGSIFFAPLQRGAIWKVAAGQVTRTTTLEPGEVSHRWPILVADSNLLLYESIDRSERSRIVAQSLSSGERRVIVDPGEYPRFAATGHLLFAVGDSLRAVRFDPSVPRVRGSPVQLIGAVSQGKGAAGRFDVSVNGTLAHVRLGTFQQESRLWRVERDGRARPFADVRRAFSWPRFSPEGDRVAAAILDSTGASHIWIYDVQRRSLTRLTFDGDANEAPIWSPDGKSLTYRSQRRGVFGLFRQPVDGGPAEVLVRSGARLYPGSWSPDGRVLAFQDGENIWLLPPPGREAKAFVNSRFGEWDGVFSPDGTLIAYTSIESGQLEVYIRTYPDSATTRTQVSNEGGYAPVWARSGRELFYMNGEKMMAVPVKRTGAQLRIEPPRLLFQIDHSISRWLANYDVTPDDKAFLMVRSERKSAHLSINVILNWYEELTRRIPTE